MKTSLLALTLLVTLCTTGCLDVDETVDVQASGAARLSISLRSDRRLATLGRGDLGADLRRRAAELDGTPGVRAEVLEEGPGAVTFVVHADDLRTLADTGKEALPGLTVSRTSRGVRLRCAVGKAGDAPAGRVSKADDRDAALGGLLARGALAGHAWSWTVRAPRIVGPDGVERTSATLRVPVAEVGEGPPRVLDVELLLEPAGLPRWVLVLGLLPALLCAAVGMARRAPGLLLRALLLAVLVAVAALSARR